MKQITLTTFAILLIAFTANAQVEIQPLVGLNFSSATETPEGVDNKARVGYQLGANLLIGDRFYVSPGVQYFAKSTEFSNNDNVEFSSDQKIQGIRIPVLVGFRIIELEDDPYVNFRIFAGPSFNYILDSDLGDESLEKELEYKDIQYAAEIGAGLDVGIFFLQAAYEFGLSNNYDNTVDNTEATFEGFDNIKSNTFFVSAGLRFTLGN